MGGIAIPDIGILENPDQFAIIERLEGKEDRVDVNPEPHNQELGNRVSQHQNHKEVSRKMTNLFTLFRSGSLDFWCGDSCHDWSPLNRSNWHCGAKSASCSWRCCKPNRRLWRPYSRRCFGKRFGNNTYCPPTA